MSQTAPKKDWVQKLAGAYQTQDMLAYTTPTSHRAGANSTASQRSVGNMNTHASNGKFQVPRTTGPSGNSWNSKSSGPTSQPSQYAESVNSMSTVNSEKPLMGEKKSERRGLKKLFS